MRSTWIALAMLAICPLLAAQQIFNNDAIIRMVKAGLSDDLIVTTISVQTGTYDTSPEGIIALSTAGASDLVIKVLVAKANGIQLPLQSSAAQAPASPASLEPEVANAQATPDTPATTPGARSGTANALPPGIDHVGVYFRDAAGNWVPIYSEPVYFEATDRVLHVATAGIVKGDVVGHVRGTHAKTALPLPATFAVYLPKRGTITPYTLYCMHAAPHSREFLFAAGGLFHNQVGTTDDLVTFQVEKLSARFYQMTVPAGAGSGIDECSGEFGLLAQSSTPLKGDSIARIYTIHAAE